MPPLCGEKERFMSITALQEHIRKKKTPLALGLGPEADRLPTPVVKRFTDLYGESVMARSEALRYHGTQLMAQAAQRLPAVVLRADRYLLCGAMGLDVLSNLVQMARSQGLYTIVDARCADPAVWLDLLKEPCVHGLSFGRFLAHPSSSIKPGAESSSPSG
jgi:hypothetical protein